VASTQEWRPNQLQVSPPSFINAFRPFHSKHYSIPAKLFLTQSAHTHTAIADQSTQTNAVTQNRSSSPPILPPLTSRLSVLSALSDPASNASTKTQHITSASLYFHAASSNPTSLALAVPRLPTEIPARRHKALSRRWTLFLRWSDGSKEEKK